MLFTNRVAFITGASRGVGKCLALRLAREGCDVAVAAKSTQSTAKLPGSIYDTAKEIEAIGRRALPLQVDVRDDAQIERAVKTTVDTFGHIDFLIHNAGALFWQPLTQTPLKRFDLVMGVNARAAFACTYHVLPAMLKQGYGHILMMSPPIDLAGAAHKIAYALSKFGMTLIAHGVAEELKDQNVACNALWPLTMIESYATINWGLGTPALWRKPDILADAMVKIFTKEPRHFTGHALLDEDFLRTEGITDFSIYRCDPAHEPPRLPFDFKLQIGKS